MTIATKCENCGGAIAMNRHGDWVHLLTDNHNCAGGVTIAEPHEFTDEECAANISAAMKSRHRRET